MGNLTREEVEQLKKNMHQLAKHGMAISIFAILWNKDPLVIKEVLEHVTEYDGQSTTPLVVAAMGGETKVVQVLLNNFNVDMEQRCTVRFDGFVIQQATALWCAAGAGHLAIVELLLKHGACVNSTTATNSTPLRAACFDGHLDIVKYLIEHGADLTIPNRYNNTCLMISCYKGHTDVVRHLLEKGADPDLKAHCGATSIHFAAECGRLDVVEELVRFGASMLKNDLGMTPLMVAAECGREDIVKFFLDQPDCLRINRIEAMELLGASFANDKDSYDLTKTWHYLAVAMTLRMQDNSAGKILKPKFEPIPAYDYHVESEDMAQLYRRRNDRNALHMEALTIRERILGSKNPEIPHPVIFRGAVFADNNRFDRCIALWMHALRLRQSNGRSINKDLLRFSQVFSQMVTIDEDILYTDVENVLQHGLAELQIYLFSGASGKTENKPNNSELYQGNILSMIYLITIALTVTEKHAEYKHSLHKLIYQFLKAKVSLQNGYSPLHIIVDPGICIDDFHVNTVVSFPDKKTVKTFLNCGADMDARDFAGNSPLHIIASARLNPVQEAARHDIIKLLLERGAHCDIVNKKGETPFCGASNLSRATLMASSDVTLRCLSARAIRRYGIPFKNHVPLCLEEFILMH